MHSGQAVPISLTIDTDRIGVFVLSCQVDQSPGRSRSSPARPQSSIPYPRRMKALSGRGERTSPGRLEWLNSVHHARCWAS